MARHALVKAYVAVGSNLGNRKQLIQKSLELLESTEDIRITARSKLVENPAIGMGDDAPAFLNGAVELETTLGSHALLKRLLEVERELGRDPKQKWEPRTIDLDLLLYGGEIISSQELMVPHPLMHERRFVLEPLNEIAPNLVHPTLQMTVSGLLESLAASDRNV